MSQIPVKFRVVQTVFQNENISDQGIYEVLKKEYPFDRSVNEKGVEDYLLTLTASGIIDQTSVTTDKNDALKLRYKITDYGKRLMKYIN
jgi:hypothetical protein